MAARHEHYRRAEELIAEGERLVKKLRTVAKEGNTGAADAYGKKAMGIWAQAQVHATLATADRSAERPPMARGERNASVARGEEGTEVLEEVACASAHQGENHAAHEWWKDPTALTGQTRVWCIGYGEFR